MSSEFRGVMCPTCYKQEVQFIHVTSALISGYINLKAPTKRMARVKELYIHTDGRRCEFVKTEELPNTAGEITVSNYGTIHYREGGRLLEMGSTARLRLGNEYREKIRDTGNALARLDPPPFKLRFGECKCGQCREAIRNRRAGGNVGRDVEVRGDFARHAPGDAGFRG